MATGGLFFHSGAEVERDQMARRGEDERNSWVDFLLVRGGRTLGFGGCEGA